MGRRQSGFLVGLGLAGLVGLAGLAGAGCQGPAHTGSQPVASAPSATSPTGPTAASPAPPTTTPSATSATAPTVPTAASPAPPTTTSSVPLASPARPNGGPGTFGPTGTGVLNGKVIAIDPGHNGGNFSNPHVINQTIFNGRGPEACDTTGTETDSGYTEALFNWNVAQVLTADLRAKGATVVLTRTSNTGVGPCVTERAAIGNNAHADAAVSIHADGGPAGGRGFAILEPVADGVNNAIVAPSRVLGMDLGDAFAAGTGEPVSSYDGTNGIQPRDDLGGTNLSTVPKVFVECANMRNPTDAALVSSTVWQARAAEAIANGLTAFVTAA